MLDLGIDKLDSQPIRRYFPSLFPIAAIVFVSSLFFYTLLLSHNGAQPNSSSFFVFFYGLIGFSAALASGGMADLAIHGGRFIDRLLILRVVICVLAGLALSSLTGLAPFSGTFETESYGFPLPFLTRIHSISNYSTGDPLAFVIDWVFWFALTYPAASLIESARRGNLKNVGTLNGVGMSSLLTFGMLPGYVGLVSLGVSFLNGALASFGPVVLLPLFFLPSAVLGFVLVKKGAGKLALTTILSSLIFTALMGISILLIVLQYPAL